MFPLALGDHVSLAAVEMREAEEIFELVESSRMYLRESLPWVDSAVSVEDTKAFIRASQKQHDDGNGVQCSIRFKGRIAGVIGFYRMDWLDKRVEIGYWLGEDYQGRGIMTACCQALVDLAFSEHELHRVEIRVATSNARSRALAERLGFRLEGTLRESQWLNDRFVDTAIYAMLDRDWTERARGGD